MKKIIMVIGFLVLGVWLEASVFLVELYSKSADDFWTVVSVTGLILVIFIFTLAADARRSGDDNGNQ